MIVFIRRPILFYQSSIANVCLFGHVWINVSSDERLQYEAIDQGCG